MDDRDQPSIIVKIFGPVVFIAGTLSSLLWFCLSVLDLIAQLDLSSHTLHFDKGAFYLLGVGLGLMILSFVLVYEFWYGKPLTTKLTEVCTKLAYFSIILLFVVPQIVYLLTNYVLEEKSYIVCEQASSQWLFVSEIVYVNKKYGCDKGIRNERTNR